jgi:hypothetical protein
MEKMKEPTVVVSTQRSQDYARWSVEELRQFAQQLRVRDARSKNRRELVELFAGFVRS